MDENIDLNCLCRFIVNEKERLVHLFSHVSLDRTLSNLNNAILLYLNDEDKKLYNLLSVRTCKDVTNKIYQYLDRNIPQLQSEYTLKSEILLKKKRLIIYLNLVNLLENQYSKCKPNKTDVNT